MKLKICLLAGILLLTMPARGQMPGGTGVSAAFAKLFGNSTAFSAKADVQVLDKSMKEWLRAPMNFTVLDGKIRVDIDLAQMRGKDITPEVISNYRQFGMDRVASVLRPDKQVMYIIYPGAKAYLNVPMSDGKGQSEAAKKFAVEKTPAGSEVIEGRACTKNRVIVKDGKGVVVLDATTWNAADLKDFPVQIATRENDNTTVMRFHQVQFNRPDLKMFEPPAGYRQR